MCFEVIIYFVNIIKRMKPKDFVSLLKPYAQQAQVDTGISYIAILAQAAVESAWGNAAPGNMYFGVKDTDGLNGNEQLLTTTEYSRRQDLKFPVILSITPVRRGGIIWYKYRIKDWFKKYDSPAECFVDHGKFFLRNKRYAEALKVKSDPRKFIEAIAKAGYATDPNYSRTLISVVNIIEKYIN